MNYSKEVGEEVRHKKQNKKNAWTIFLIISFEANPADHICDVIRSNISK